MARFLSQVATIMRGSVGGLTYSANQFHQLIARARTAPVQPGTTLQAAVRNALSAASIRWKDSLTQTERSDWQDYALTCLYSGPLGSYTVTGRDLYIAGRGLAQYLFAEFGIGALVDTVPTEPGFYALSGIDVAPPTAPGTGFRLSVNNYGTHDLSLLAQRSIAWNPTRTRFKGPWATAYNQGVDAPTATSTLIEFTGLVAGMRYFWRVKGVVNDSGHAITASFTGSAIAATTV